MGAAMRRGVGSAARLSPSFPPRLALSPLDTVSVAVAVTVDSPGEADAKSRCLSGWGSISAVRDAQEQGPLFTAALAGAKDALDPGWVCNPGVLLAERG